MITCKSPCLLKELCEIEQIQLAKSAHKYYFGTSIEFSSCEYNLVPILFVKKRCNSILKTAMLVRNAPLNVDQEQCKLLFDLYSIPWFKDIIHAQAMKTSIGNNSQNNVKPVDYIALLSK
jgi:hypothetical protein